MMPSMSRPSGSSANGPIVTRRVGPTGNGSALPAASLAGRGSASGASGAKAVGSAASSDSRVKPSVRQTIDSMVSTGSQADYFKYEQTIILFDWDDTLCPSNWIRENRPALSFFKPCPQDEKYQRPLRELSKLVDETLRIAMKMGKVIIVTNAMDPWVETSCRNFMPSILPLVMGIPIIYARSVYETYSLERNKSPARPAQPGGAMPGMYSSNGTNKLAQYNARLALQADEMAPQRWKEVAFEQEITGFYSRYEHQSWKNVISIGDSIFERDAVRRVVIQRPSTQKKCRIKTAKLLDEPAIEELIQQVRVVHEALALMVQCDGNLDIEIDEDDLKMDLSLTEKIMERWGAGEPPKKPDRTNCPR